MEIRIIKENQTYAENANDMPLKLKTFCQYKP